MKKQHLIPVLLTALFTVGMPARLRAQETSAPCASEGDIVHYCNLDDPGFPEAGFRARKVWGTDPRETRTAQYFVAATDNVTSVTWGVARLGSPGGRTVVSIRSLINGRIGTIDDTIGVLGEVEIDSHPQVSPGSLPPFLDLVTVEGRVTGLTPGERYALVLEDVGATITGSSSSTVFSLVGSPTNVRAVRLTDKSSGGWIAPFSGERLFARIAGGPAEPELKIDRAVQISWPETKDAVVLERASSPEGPWKPVNETLLSVDGENRVTLLTDTDNNYFRLRYE